MLQFFDPVPCWDVRIHYAPDGRPKGEATVEFEAYEDVLEAIKKDKQFMGKRYIDLEMGPPVPPLPENLRRRTAEEELEGKSDEKSDYGKPPEQILNQGQGVPPVQVPTQVPPPAAPMGYMGFQSAPTQVPQVPAAKPNSAPAAAASQGKGDEEYYRQYEEAMKKYWHSMQDWWNQWGGGSVMTQWGVPGSSAGPPGPVPPTTQQPPRYNPY